MSGGWFAYTSQAQRWTLSLEEQDRLRSGIVRNDLSQLQQPEASSVSVSVLLSQQELVLHYQSSCIYQICSEMRRSWRLRATAVVYFRRFYTRQSLWDVDPRAAIIGCIFLAGKTDHEFVDMSRLLEGYFRKGTEQQIIDVEMLLLETLDYDLQVFHVQNCIYGFIADFKRRFQDRLKIPPDAQLDKSPWAEALQQWTDRAVELCDSVLLTGLYLAYSPSELAIRLMLKTVPAVLAADCDSYFREAAQSHHASHTLETILQSMPLFHEQCTKAAVGRDLTSDVAVAEVRGAMQTLARSARWGSSKQKASSAAAAQATPPAVSAPGATTSGQRSL